jgi:hypothetical protein
VLLPRLALYTVFAPDSAIEIIYLDIDDAVE